MGKNQIIYQCKSCYWVGEIANREKKCSYCQDTRYLIKINKEKIDSKEKEIIL